jgi:hypothetical protein
MFCGVVWNSSAICLRQPEGFAFEAALDARPAAGNPSSAGVVSCQGNTKGVRSTAPQVATPSWGASGISPSESTSMALRVRGSRRLPGRDVEYSGGAEPRAVHDGQTARLSEPIAAAEDSTH